MMQKLTLLFVSTILASSLLEAQDEIEEQRPPTPSPQVFEAKVGTFEFIAADPGSLQIARRVGREVLDVCDELITPPLERIPIIDVKLAPDGRGNLDGKSHLLFEDRAGDYGLAIAWNENLSIALFTQALTESYLRQLVFTLSDRARAEQVPPWLIAGANLRVQVALRPALVEYLKELGRASEMVSLDELLEKDQLKDLSPADRIASYWFLELVTRQLDQEKSIRAYFDTVVAGKPAVETLAQQSEVIRSFPSGVEGWWIIGFQDIIHRENGIVLSLERSAKQLFVLNRFELIRNGRPFFSTASELWDLRDEPVIEQACTGRLREIESVLPRVNPVFYNAFRSLGLVMQTLLSGSEADYAEASANFEEDLRIATNLAQESQILAENPEAEIEVAIED